MTPPLALKKAEASLVIALESAARCVRRFGVDPAADSTEVKAVLLEAAYHITVVQGLLGADEPLARAFLLLSDALPVLEESSLKSAVGLFLDSFGCGPEKAVCL